MSRSRHLLFAEGRTVGLFDPLDQLRPGYLLRNGALTIAERWIALLQPESITAAARPWLANTINPSSGWQVNAAIDEIPGELWIIEGAPSPIGAVEAWSQPEGSGSWRDGHHAIIVLDKQTFASHRQTINDWITRGGQGACPIDAPGTALTGEVHGPGRTMATGRQCATAIGVRLGIPMA